MKRRDFLTGSALALLGATARGYPAAGQASAEPIIDIHQHLGYSGRPDEVLLAHQRAIGATTTILLPAGRPVTRPSTHDGVRTACRRRRSATRRAISSFGHIVTHSCLARTRCPISHGATREIERYLKRGAKVIAEQKFGVECDSPEMQRIYALAQAYDVPVLMHWQFKMYNYGFERFHKMLEKFPRVNFLGHAQTWWANIDRNHTDQTVLYPKGPVTPGGLTDRYLSDYPNMYGDLSAGSGLNALTRDEDFTRDFLTRHHDKLLFGSDCRRPRRRRTEVSGRADHRARSAAWRPTGRSSGSCSTRTRKRCFGCDGNRYLGLLVSPRSHRDTETHGEFKISDTTRHHGVASLAAARPAARNPKDANIKTCLRSGSCVCVFCLALRLRRKSTPSVQHACFACVNSASAYPMPLRDSRSFCV